MADIKRAIEYAKRNPNTPMATELRKRIESGQLNNELAQANINLPSQVLQSQGFVSEGETPGIFKPGKKIGEVFGVEKFFRGLGQTAANLTGTTKKVTGAMDTLQKAQGDIIRRIQQNRKLGKDTQRLQSEANRLGQEIQQLGGQTQSILTDDLEDREVIGSAIQTAGLAIPGVGKGASLGTKVAAGFGTGFVSDIGASLQNMDKKTIEAFKPGLGAFIGAALPLAGAGLKAAKKLVTNKAPRGVINNLIRPKKANLAYGKDPAGALIKENIVAKNWDDLVSKVDDAIKRNADEFNTAVANSKKIIDASDIVKSLDDGIDEAVRLNNASVANQLIAKKRAITEVLETTLDDAGKISISGTPRDLSKLTPAQAVELKRNVLGKLAQFTGNASDDKLVNAAVQKSYRQLDSLIDDVVPGSAKINQQISSLIGAQNAIKSRSEALLRQNLIGLTGTLKTAGGAAASLLTGNPLFFALSAGETAFTEGLKKNPQFATLVASKIRSMAPEAIEDLVKAAPSAMPFIQNALRNVGLAGVSNIQNQGQEQEGFTIPTIEIGQNAETPNTPLQNLGEATEESFLKFIAGGIPGLKADQPVPDDVLDAFGKLSERTQKLFQDNYEGVIAGEQMPFLTVGGIQSVTPSQLVGSFKTNAIMQLKREGADDIAQQVANISDDGIKTFADLKRAVQQTLGTNVNNPSVRNWLKSVQMLFNEFIK